MKLRKVLPLLISLFILILPQPCPPLAAAKIQFSILYTNDVMGEVEPCG
jgi:hypothetical protein